jgi:hypothetical protein
MSQRMAESVSQQNFYGDQGLHHMSSQATMGEMDENLFHDSHLQLQEQMRNPTTFHAEMMGDIMYLQQALIQPLSKQSSRKSMNTCTPTTGHSGSKVKFLKTSR